MTTTRSNGFGGIANGTAVTVGNSGGTSGDAVSSVTTSNSTPVSDNTHVAYGAQAVKMNSGATAGAPALLYSSLAYGASTRVYFRFYIYWSSLGTSFSPPIFRGRSSTAVQALRIARTAAGKLQILNGASSQVAISANALSIGTMYRIEGSCTVTGGLGDLSYYVLHSTTPVETALSVTGQAFGSLGIDETTYGQIGTVSNIPDFWIDEIAVSDAGPIGPAIKTVSLTAGAALAGPTTSIVMTDAVLLTAAAHLTGPTTSAALTRTVQLSAAAHLTVSAAAAIVPTVQLSAAAHLAGPAAAIVMTDDVLLSAAVHLAGPTAAAAIVRHVAIAAAVDLDRPAINIAIGPTVYLAAAVELAGPAVAAAIVPVHDLAAVVELGAVAATGAITSFSPVKHLAMSAALAGPPLSMRLSRSAARRRAMPVDRRAATVTARRASAATPRPTDAITERRG